MLRAGAAVVAVAMLVACGAGSSSSPIPSVGSAGASKSLHPMDSTGNLADGGFESGGFTSWQQCGTVNASIVTTRSHAGSYSEFSGTTAKPEINGDSGVCQQVKIPTAGKLTFWVYEGTNETSTTYSYQDVALLSSGSRTSTTVAQLAKEVVTTSAWTQRTYDLSSYAGQTVWLYFGVHADGYSSDYIYSYIDDVAITGSATASPSPSPSPTATASPTKSPSPSPTPTASPTKTPSPSPTPTKTPTPSPTPTPGGGPTPFPTPAGSGPHGGTCGSSCGVERWHIKTLDDGDEHLINWTPVSASVTTLRNIAVPSGFTSSNDTTRYAPTETQVYTVRAILVGWKTESDHDFHMVIADPNNTSNTMIVEPPDPTCNDACDSGFPNIYSATRTKLTNCFGTPPSSFTNFTTTIVADFTGVAFFDVLHGQTGVAPNGIELHPLLNVTFVSGAPGC